MRADTLAGYLGRGFDRSYVAYSTGNETGLGSVQRATFRRPQLSCSNIYPNSGISHIVKEISKEISVKVKNLILLTTRLGRCGALAILVVLAGCAAPHSDLLFKERKLTSDTEGLIVMALGYKKPIDSRIDWGFETLGLQIDFQSTIDSAKERYAITTSAHSYMAGAWKDEALIRKTPNSARVLVGYVIPPGKYKLTNQAVFLYGSTGWNFYKSRGNWSGRPALASPIEFEVRPNSVTYLGIREVEVEGGTNLFDQTVPARVRVNAQSEFKDDVELLYRNRPELRSVPIFNVFER